MLSKGRIKYIHSLRQKKQRDTDQKFVVEGDKLVKEFLNSGWTISELFALPGWITDLPDDLVKKPGQVMEVSDLELKKISSLTTPNQALAVIEKPDLPIHWEELKTELSLFLDTIQDPGNLGTIIRIAAWFGIKNVICSTTTVDLFNAKVVQATMGAMIYVNVHYTNPEDFFEEFSKTGLPIYGTYPAGESIYKTNFENNGIIILGNESQGISKGHNRFVSHCISIPGYGLHSKNIESLNVAIAAAIVCSEFKRKEMG